MKDLKELITIDVKLTYSGGRLLLVHNGAILVYLKNILDAEKILNHPQSIFKLSKSKTDYRILNSDLSENFKQTHDFAY